VHKQVLELTGICGYYCMSCCLQCTSFLHHQIQAGPKSDVRHQKCHWQWHF